MKVLVTLDIPQVGINLLEAAGLEVEVWKEVQPLTPGQLSQKAKSCKGLLSTAMDHIDAAFIQDNLHLEIISQYGAGYDNIDVGAATDAGIIVGNAPEAMSDATADISFMLMLAASRKLCYLHKSIINGQWGFFQPQAHLGQELKGKTLGIYGLGRIGLEMAKRCVGAYGMGIIYCNRGHNKAAETLLGAKKVDFHTLLTSSDVLSVHCALTDETKGIFGKQAFEQMKPSAIFVNTARGPIHQEQDLIAALKSGEIWGAGLDVSDPEPMKPNNPLLGMENVVVTPHIGSATLEARDQMAVLAAQNIVQYFKGKTVSHRVN